VPLNKFLLLKDQLNPNCYVIESLFLILAIPQPTAQSENVILKILFLWVDGQMDGWVGVKPDLRNCFEQSKTIVLN
jgi:hypothetical protein